MLPSPSPRPHLSGRLVDLRQLVATYGDIPLRVLARDLAADSARDDMPAHVPARIPDIPVHDHIIVAGDVAYRSFAEDGAL